MVPEAVTLLIGIVIILFLADVTIRESLRLAKHFRWSATFVGLTILSIGTSIPEIMTAVIGSIDILRDQAMKDTISGLVLGTNVGSDIFQQSLILAVVGIIGTITVIKEDLLSELGALIMGAVLMLLAALGGFINRLEGFIMLGTYLGYLFYLGQRQKRANSLEKITKRKLNSGRLSKGRITLEILIILGAFVIMGFTANQVIKASTVLVAQLPISASFFGVILLGVASALPELTTALIGVFRGNKEISSGVLIGSNVTNPLLGIGLGAFISGYHVPNVIFLYDLPVKIGIAGLLFFFLYRKEKLGRWEAFVLIALFFMYLLFRQIYFPVDF
ncbi:hypothetical protein COV20_05735 [Candidatus Woesearchaeota archaeon CG10_big_fil_rev_8_21_14_0_10_45_16]|nr:MAG: hypothetical protein COV20_05735 [Candidatus Woesearchaeota archaeon CG10_big_fil_rev_8_21_14_0_10_45_16]